MLWHFIGTYSVRRRNSSRERLTTRYVPIAALATFRTAGPHIMCSDIPCIRCPAVLGLRDASEFSRRCVLVGLALGVCPLSLSISPSPRESRLYVCTYFTRDGSPTNTWSAKTKRVMTHLRPNQNGNSPRTCVYTLNAHFCTFGGDLHAQSVPSNEISASELKSEVCWERVVGWEGTFRAVAELAQHVLMLCFGHSKAFLCTLCWSGKKWTQRERERFFFVSCVCMCFFCTTLFFLFFFFSFFWKWQCEKKGGSFLPGIFFSLIHQRNV